MILVDWDMICHRCYRAMDHLTTADGMATGMEFGVLRILKTLKERISKEDHEIVLCLESYTAKSKRIGWYKANRKKPSASFYKRKDILLKNLQLIHRCGIANGCEADQVMHTLSQEPGMVYIYSNDSDMFQSISKSTVIVRSFSNQLFFWTERKLFDKHIVRPWQYAFYKTIVGDKTDNIPGIARIPKKLAAEISRYAWNKYVIDKKMEHGLALGTTLLAFLDRCSTKLATKVSIFVNTQLLLNLELIQFSNTTKIEITPLRKGDIQPYLDAMEIKSLTFTDEMEF